MAKMMMTLLVALTAGWSGWCASTSGVTGGHDVETASGGQATLHRDRFLSVRPGEFGVINDAGATGTPLDATNNYWGARGGPRDAAHNPTGRGTPVSAGVTYRPWLTR